jgi:septal ring factor EnvC (AmiA/AmiB activator)
MNALNRRFIIPLSTALVLLLVFCLDGPAHPARNPKKKLSEIEKKLSSKKKKIKEAIRQEQSILSRLQNIDKKIQKQERELKRYDRLISNTQARIIEMTKEINSMKGSIDRRKQYLRKRLQVLYQKRYGSYALLLFRADDYGDLIKRSKYISLLAYHDSRMIHKYRESVKELDFKKKSLEMLYRQLDKNRAEARQRKKALQIEKKKKDRLLATIRSKRSFYERTIKELEVSKKKLRKMIESLKARKLPKSVTGRGFRAMKGRLPWPVNGKILVPYGKYRDPKFNITVFKNGIEIKASPNSKPRAIAGGRVVYADWFKGYGLLLIVNHGGGYHSLYGNLSETFHKAGDIISKGAIIGKVGRSGLLNVPTLYFEIRYKGKPVNPLKWLKRRSRVRKKVS